MKRRNYSSLVHHTSRQGFTVVELIIVIIVLAILATIITLSYASMRQGAIEDSLKSDLRNSMSALEVFRTENNAYPASSAAADLQASGDNAMSYYTTGDDGYCVDATNNGVVFHVSSSTKTIEPSACEDE